MEALGESKLTKGTLSSLQTLFPLLQCPDCKKSFDFLLVQQIHLEEREFGILSCSCSKYPVIDGIPIFLKRPIEVQSHIGGKTQVHGPLPDVLISLISQNKGIEALLSLIAFPWCSGFFRRIRLLRRITQRNPIRGISFFYRKRFCGSGSLLILTC